MSSLDDLISLFSKLPGLGPRSARRVILFLLKNRQYFLKDTINLLNKVNIELVDCEVCRNIDTKTPCRICQDELRVNERICVVEEVSDLWAIEKCNLHDGKYHVLGGVLSAIDGVGPDELNISNLVKKVNMEGTKEIILATNSTVEGQLTAQYIADILKNNDILITRLAQGLPMGSELDFMDNGTLLESFRSRKKI